MAKASARHILVPSEADCLTLKKLIGLYRRKQGTSEKPAKG